MRLHHELLFAGRGSNAASTSTAGAMLFLHGILGSGKNLRTVAQRFVDARPDWLGVLVDLRAHGRSLGVGGDDTVDGAAADVAELCASLAVPTRGVLAHSFGGKVALLLPRAVAGLEHLVVVDSAPGLRRAAPGSGSTLEVVGLLEQLAGPSGLTAWARRDDFVEAVEARGYPKSVGQWLAMNLRRDADGLRFGLALPRVRALLDSYFAVDLWPVVEAAARGRAPPRVHLVMGDSSPVYEEADRRRAEALARDADGFVTVDVLPTGHWVHADDPEGLLRVMLARI